MIILKEKLLHQDSATGMLNLGIKNLVLLKISSGDDFKINDIITGKTSGTRGIASSITSYESDFKLGPYSK